MPGYRSLADNGPGVWELATVTTVRKAIADVVSIRVSASHKDVKGPESPMGRVCQYDRSRVGERDPNTVAETVVLTHRNNARTDAHCHVARPIDPLDVLDLPRHRDAFSTRAVHVGVVPDHCAGLIGRDIAEPGEQCRRGLCRGAGRERPRQGDGDE